MISTLESLFKSAFVAAWTEKAKRSKNTPMIKILIVLIIQFQYTTNFVFIPKPNEAKSRLGSGDPKADRKTI